MKNNLFSFILTCFVGSATCGSPYLMADDYTVHITYNYNIFREHVSKHTTLVLQQINKMLMWTCEYNFVKKKNHRKLFANIFAKKYRKVREWISRNVFTKKFVNLFANNFHGSIPKGISWKNNLTNDCRKIILTVYTVLS